MKYSGKTDIGIKRLNNQDSYAVFSKDNYFCAIVCDFFSLTAGCVTLLRLLAMYFRVKLPSK